jgi:DNA helicase-2/ATP-dependent DNA helicase PcrA
MSLNSTQLQAIAHKDGPCMVLAGPGSGKTTVITKRIMCLIENYKVNPEEILVITFSKNATKEMKERFHALKPTNSKLVTFGTFHGIYY